jgi:hypothetical protein
VVWQTGQETVVCRSGFLAEAAGKSLHQLLRRGRAQRQDANFARADEHAQVALQPRFLKHLRLEDEFIVSNNRDFFHGCVPAYLEDWLEHGRRMRAAQDQNPPPVVVRLRTLAAQRQHAEIPIT